MTMTDATPLVENFGDLSGPTARNYVCRPCGSDRFRLTALPFTEVTGVGAASAGVFGDLVTETETSASTRTSFAISVEPTGPTLPSGIEVSVADPSVASAPVGGISTGLTQGDTYFVARAPDGSLSAVKASVAIDQSSSVTRRTGFVEGSARKNAFDQIESRTSGRGRECLPVWSTRDISSKTYAWNDECWAADIENKTCISPYNTATGGGCVLVTPRHMLTCHHLSYYPKPGAKIHLVRPDGTTDEHTVESVEPHPYSEGYTVCPWDVVAIKLDRDVHQSIKFAKVLPLDHRPWFPTGHYNQLYGQNPQITTVTGEPPTWRACHMTKRFGLALSYVFCLPFEPIPYYSGSIPPWQGGQYTHVGHKTGTTDLEFGLIYPENPLGEPIISGDSGSPAFIVLNNELVLTNVWSSPSWGYPLYADPLINDMLATLGGGYQLTVADMSGFQVY